MKPNETSIFERMLAGGLISFADPEYPKIFEEVSKTIQQSLALNTSTAIGQIRKRLSEVIGQPVDESTTVFTPFHTNFGKHISLGKNVFINHGCTFLDLGGIVIEDEVLVGPKGEFDYRKSPRSTRGSQDAGLEANCPEAKLLDRRQFRNPSRSDCGRKFRGSSRVSGH
uniref:hypothetical protein n=1 Tax=Algoriphagus sp. TaxID=1872435 RepID=UPI004047A2D8